MWGDVGTYQECDTGASLDSTCNTKSPSKQLRWPIKYLNTHIPGRWLSLEKACLPVFSSNLHNLKRKIQITWITSDKLHRKRQKTWWVHLKPSTKNDLKKNHKVINKYIQQHTENNNKIIMIANKSHVYESVCLCESTDFMSALTPEQQ